MQKVRDWLLHYSIFMDLTQKVIIAGAALYVSYSAYVISQQQLQISRASFDPDLYIAGRGEQPGFGEVVEIVNIGGPVHNTRVVIDTFVVMTHAKIEKKTTLLPFKGYYSSTSNIGQMGSVYRAWNVGNREQFNKVVIEARSYPIDPISIDMDTIITVYYANRLEEERRAWFWNGNRVRENSITKYAEIKNLFNELRCTLALSNLSVALLEMYEERQTTRTPCSG